MSAGSIVKAETPPDLSRDVSDPRLLPGETPLAMPEQDFSRRVERRGAAGQPSTRDHAKPSPDDCRSEDWIARSALILATLLLTAAFGYELFRILSQVQITPLQIAFLALSTAAFAWMAFGTLSAAMGFLVLYGDEKSGLLTLGPVQAPRSRTALLFPVYHEAPERIAGTIEAMVDDLASQLGPEGAREAFEIFILSDTRGPAGVAEEARYAAFAGQMEGRARVYYRRRRENRARKAGNIKDWVERFGAGYPYFIVLDADSVMSADTLAGLANAMERDPEAGLIQTVPRLTGGVTLLQRLQQFATNVYGPIVSAGLAVWHRRDGNYWGHNAIIRTRAFAEAAGLPPLPGPPPFGGHVQSHDFVEAALLQRAGWSIRLVAHPTGSYEGAPPNLVDLAIRDRRWAQGNLQHLAIAARPGLTAMGRTHLLMGAFSYIVSMVWAASLVVGLVLALQGQQMIPSYFADQRTLFPIWPVFDTGGALRLFAVTMLVVLLPKLLGFIIELKRARAAREEHAGLRAAGGVFAETVYSMLLAPVHMVNQTIAITEILIGRDSGWAAQRRDGAAIAMGDALTAYRLHLGLGILLTAVCAMISTEILMWLSPVLLGLALAPLLGWVTSRNPGPILSALLSTPEDRAPPPVLSNADRLTATWNLRFRAIAQDNEPLPKGAAEAAA